MVKAKRFLWSPDGARWYVRRKGKYHRIGAAPGTEDFDREYWAILNGRQSGIKTTWAALIENFRASDRWRGLSPRTRADYDNVFAYIVEKNRARDVTRVTRADAIKAMEANAHRVRFGNYVASVMSVLCERALELGWIRHNPVRGVRKARMPEDRRAPHEPWPDRAIAAFRGGAQPLARLAFEIGIGTGQRPSDWCKFTWGDYDGQTLRLTQGKTGRALVLPVTPDLRAALDQARPDPCPPARPILWRPDGGPFSYRTLAWLMLSERKRLGLEAFDLHALRYRAAHELALAGCSDDEIAAITGHTSRAMIRKYAGAARQITQAQSAQAKRGNGRGTK